MPLQLTAAPAIEPVTLAEAKAYLKVDTSDDDALITTLIAAARARAEWHTGRAFITQGWTLWLDAWPDDGCTEIPLPPLQSVTSLTTYARDDTATVLSSTNYTVDTRSSPGRIALDCDVALPSDLRRINGIGVAFSAGYGSAASAVPAPIRQAILQIVAELYAHRGDAADAPSPAILALLAPYKVLNF